MAFNLLDAAKGFITNELISKAGSFLGESESGITKAISGILPSLIGGLTDKATSDEGAHVVADLCSKANSSGHFNDPMSFFNKEDGGNLLYQGAGLLSGLFSNSKIASLSEIISNFSGIKSSSANSLLSMATPVVLGLLGKHAAANNVNAAGLASLLSTQKNSVINAMPSGLNVRSVVNSLYDHTDKNVHSAGSSERHISARTPGSSDSGLKWLLPLLLLLLILAAAWYYLNKGCKGDGKIAAGVDSLKTTIEQIATAAAGKVDSLTGDFIYEPGQNVKIELPNNAGTLDVGENSTEEKLYKFLTDTNATLDTVKGNWFEFTNVHFKTGGVQLDSASLVQLKNIVAITKAFPAAEFKLGGYTDNTGDSAANVALSQKRAEAVVAQLKKFGAAASSITGAKGYGPQWPLADNATAEGRAINRRVAVNVKAK